MTLLAPITLCLAGTACQGAAFRHLAPRWEGRRADVTWRFPRREFFTVRGWVYQVAAFMLWLLAVITMLAIPPW
jgi:hypothetical protein